ncbi:MAG: hypothetical protein Q9157_002060 [Trypethelium eluteriae]
MKNATFGFTFGQASTQPSARKTPQPRSRSASLRPTPQSRSGGRSRSKTPASSSNEASAGSSRKSPRIASRLEKPANANDSLFVTPTVVGKRKRPDPVPEVDEGEDDELERNDDEHRPLSANGNPNTSVAKKKSVPIVSAEDDDLQAMEKENQAPEEGGSGTKRISALSELVPNSDNRKMKSTKAFDADNRLSSLQSTTQTTSRLLEAGPATINGQGSDDDDTETGMSYSIEAKYIPRRSYQSVGKLDLTGKAKAKSSRENGSGDKNQTSKQKAADRNFRKSQNEPAANVAEAASPSIARATKKPNIPAIRRLQAGKSSASSNGDPSPATIRKKFQQATPALAPPKSIPTPLTADRRLESSEIGPASSDMTDQVQSEQIEASTTATGISSGFPAGLLGTTMKPFEGTPSGLHDQRSAQHNSRQSSSFVIPADGTLADSPADWRPAAISLEMHSSYRSPDSSSATAGKITQTKRRKANRASSLSNSSQNAVPVTQSPPPAAPARKRNRNTPGISVPITIYRLSGPLLTAHDFDSASDSEDLPSHDPSTSTNTHTRSNAPNAIDVLAQATSELLSSRADTLHNQSVSLPAAAKYKKKRGVLERKRNAVTQFQEEVENHLFELTSAVDANAVLGTRLRGLEKQKVALREELLAVRQRREEVALETDELRSTHTRHMEVEREERGLRVGIEDLEVAVRRGRDEEGRRWEEGTWERGKGDVGIEGKASFMGEANGRGPEGSGLLELVKRFNENLGKAAETLERRNGI